jgi:hypothetical protein
LGQAGAEPADPRKRGALAQVGFIFFHAALLSPAPRARACARIRACCCSTSNVVPMLLAVWFASNGEATLQCPRRDPDARSTTGRYRMDTLVAKFSLEEPMPDLQDLIARWPRHGQLGQACGRHTTRTSKRRRLTLAVLLIVDCRQAARSQILEAAKARFRDGFGKARDHVHA